MSSHRNWKSIFAWGCGVPVLLLLLLGLGIVIVAHGISEQASQARSELDLHYPDQSHFRPPLDDRVAQDRLNRFLRVRRRLQPFCEEIRLLERVFSDAEQLSKEMEERGEGEFHVQSLFRYLDQVARAGTSLLDVGRTISDYGRTRNQALLESEMGLGEYTWIYAVANFGLLGEEPRPFPIEKSSRARIFLDRARNDLLGMLRRHLEDIRRHSGDTDSLRFWETEIAQLETEPERVPSSSGLPPSLETSLATSREDLEGASCPIASELDLMLIERQGLRYEHR